MNKTVTINISGIIFHIEEDAYDRLSRYLSTIKSYFSTSEGRDEIMMDIEARIAELLQEKISVSKQVVTMTDVEHVVGIMGKPEDFAGESETKTEEAAAAPEARTYNGRRRLYRDPDEKILGGVCSGIAHYFDFDVVWVRVALVLMTMLGFSGVFLYIILWIVVPEAKTTAEKLQMRGEPVDINHISKSVQEEAENLKKKGREFGDNLSSRASSAGSRIGDFFHDFFTQFFKVFGRILGLALLLFSIFLLIVFSMTLFGFSVAEINVPMMREIMEGVFDSAAQKRFAYFGLILLIAVPLMLIMYFGIKLLFKIKYKNRWIGATGGILWVAGIAICTYVAIKQGTNFTEYATVEESAFVPQQYKDTLYIGMDMTQEYNQPDLIAGANGKKEYVEVNGEEWVVKDGEKKVFIGMPRVKIIRNHIDSVEVTVVNSSHGRSRSEAQLSASGVEYTYSVKDSALLVNNFFTIPDKDKWRAQDVEVYIKIPEGKVVYLDKTVKKLISNNLSYYYDEEIVNRRWKMTHSGLECIDCKGLKQRGNIHNEIEEHKRAIRELKNELIRNEVEEGINEVKEEIKKEL